jgi:protein-S-isoprenylcysteine O-methyltransferase Ste14
MDSLRKRAIAHIVSFQAVMALMLFLPAWTVRYWEAWVYWILFSACALLVTLDLLKRDPGLVESRLKVGPQAEREKSQKIIQAFASIFFCGLILVPGIERRFHLSIIPLPLVLVADAFVLTGYLIIFLVLRENSYASSTIEVRPGQRVIATGPYRIVRHPMYAGAALMILATPLALASLWALTCAVLLCGVIVARLVVEYLAKNLPRYEEYCRKVRYRLIPCVW